MAFYPQLENAVPEEVFGDSFTYANIGLTPEAILSNQIGLFNADFFSEVDDVNDIDSTVSLANTLRDLVSNIYVTLRNISIMAMLIIIVYIGIRMLISLSPAEKSRYKEGFINCIVGLVIIVGMHYAMSFANEIIDNVTNSVTNSNFETDLEEVSNIWKGVEETRREGSLATGDYWMDELQNLTEENPSLIEKHTAGMSIAIVGTEIEDAFSSDSAVSFEKDEDGVGTLWIAVDNIQELARYKSQEIYKIDGNGTAQFNWNFIGWAFIYVMLTVLTIAFAWMYAKRMLYLAGLTMFAPIVGVMYPINKADGSRAQTLNLWFKEYFGNLIIQPIHLLLYTMLIGGSMRIALDNPIYTIVALMGLVFIEKLLVDLMGIQDTRIGGLGKSLQDTNRAIHTATETTKRAARSVASGVKKAARTGKKVANAAKKSKGKKDEEDDDEEDEDIDDEEDVDDEYVDDEEDV